MSYKFPPEDRAELVRLMGEGGADELGFIVRLSRMSPDIRQSAMFVERAAGLPRGALAWVYRDQGWRMRRIAELSSELADLLKGEAFLPLHEENRRTGWYVGEEPVRPGAAGEEDLILASGSAIAILQDRLLHMSAWAAAAAPKRATGRPKDPARHVLLWAVIGACDSAGVRRATGDTAALVKVARIAFRHAEPDQGQWGDPRDMLRALKAAGDLQQRPEAGDEQREEVEGE